MILHGVTGWLFYVCQYHRVYHKTTLIRLSSGFSDWYEMICVDSTHHFYPSKNAQNTIFYFSMLLDCLSLNWYIDIDWCMASLLMNEKTHSFFFYFETCCLGHSLSYKVIGLFFFPCQVSFLLADCFWPPGQHCWASQNRNLIIHVHPSSKTTCFHFLFFSEMGDDGNRAGLRENEGQTMRSFVCCCSGSVLILVKETHLLCFHLYLSV